jgi:broad specificity phosphatase PhoE
MGWRIVHLIRHGATIRNHDDPAVDRIRGHDDVGLSAKGISEANRLAGEIARNSPAVLFSSDLVRAVKTAEIIADWNRISLEKPTSDFRPWDVGGFTGKPSSEVFPVLARFALHTPDEVVPGGESFNAFRNRFLNGLAKRLRQYEGEIGIVAHHRNERFLVAWATAGFPWDGSYDEKEFMKKGKSTGSRTIIQIPVYEKLVVPQAAPVYNRLKLVKEHLSRREGA